MAGVRLLQIKTAFAILEIHGPLRSRWGSIQGTGIGMPRLAVESTKQPVDVTWADAGGHMHVWPEEQGGPSFFEDTTYRLRVRSLVPGRTPTTVHRDPSLLQNIDPHPDDHTCTGTVNFRRQVGLSTLEVRVEHETLRVTIEVFPVKLDYDEDYQAVLSDVASAGRGLALEYLRATYRSGVARETEHVTGLEWVTLLRNEIDLLEKAVSYINNHPHRSLSRDIKETRVEQIKRVDASVRRAVI
jgi:hypothetical protein